jgi:hypothetical protein
MIAFNHALSGALLAKYLPLPIALPLAFVSHFVLDSLPHFGIPHHMRDHSKIWRIFSLIDIGGALVLAGLAISWHEYWMLIGGIIACSPDFIWVGRVLKSRSFKLDVHTHPFSKWHAKIQRFERPWGLIIDVIFASIMSFYFFKR